MNENLQEDWLDARLREEASYIDDAGFTSSVIQRLPAQRVRRSFRAAILLAVTALASVIVYLLAGNSGFIAEALTRFIFMPLSLIYLVAISAGLLLMGFGVGAAMSKTRGQRLR
jgi:hypothetical protein